MLKFELGLAREIITPERGLPLAGYFNGRPNTGVADELFVRVSLFRFGKLFSGIVTFDLLFLPAELIVSIQKELRNAGFDFAEDLIFHATHTHTAPYTETSFGTAADPEYLDTVVTKAFLAISMAYADLAPAELLVASGRNSELAFNRRYFMKDGTVKTNPGKSNPDVVKPEGPIDDEITVLAAKRDGRLVSIYANIVNHTDTIGGNLVSGDWPGRMEQAIRYELGYDVNVQTLIGCAGDINHVDIHSAVEQSSYAEALRIGRAYAQTVLKLLDLAEPVDLSENGLFATTEVLSVTGRVLSSEEIRKAQDILERTRDLSTATAMTADDLAAGDGPTAKFFAEQALSFAQCEAGKKREFHLIALRIGKEIGIVTLPGEPFVEVGLGIKAQSPYQYTIVIGLAQGAAGYIPMKECFSRGGYEIQPVCNGGAQESTAAEMISIGSRMLNEITPEKIKEYLKCVH